MQLAWIIVFAIGVAQGLFLTAALLGKRSANPAATRTLAALVAVFTLLIGGELLEFFLAPPARHLLTAVNINTELAIGPLLLLMVRYLFEPDRGFRDGDKLQYLPLALGIVGWLQVPPAAFQSLVPAYVLFKALFLYAYLAIAYRTLARGIAASDRMLAGRRTVSLGWLKRWIAFLGLVASIIYLAFFIDRLTPLRIDSDEIGSLILALVIYLLSLMVILRPWILSVRPRPADRERFAGEVAALTAYLEREQPFLEPDLDLAQLAEALGHTPNTLSRIINRGLARSFYDLLNDCRLTHFERLAADARNRRRSVLELAFESGFNSKASFYRAFQQTHGMTPTQYRERLAEQQTHRPTNGPTDP